ncbi:hypothetical protein D3C81_2295830 [compost metagenome]
MLYSLDIEQLQGALASGQLEGQRVDTEEGDGVLIASPLPKVYAFLDDQANSDVFSEVARFVRVTE